jgi:DNA polymerase IIIc chi subunit
MKYKHINGILPLTYITTYARKDQVPSGSGILFAVDHRYPNSKMEKSSRFFRMEFTEFFERLMVTPRDKRCYYECVEGDDRKPYADIEYEYSDLNKEEAFTNFNLIIRAILLGIQYEMNAKGVPYSEDRDCIKISSHGPGKLSIHIIINNWYFNKCSDVHNSNNKIFWTTIRDKYVPKHLWHFVKIDKENTIPAPQEIPQDAPLIINNAPLIINNTNNIKKNTGETIDTCVYSSFRQFRLIWNTKLGKDRFLEIDPSTGLQARFPKNPNDPNNLPDNVQQLRLFEACLITMTSNCKQLPDWISSVDNTKQQAAIRNMVTINDDQRDRMVQLFNASDHSKHYRLDFNQRTSPNSIYLMPITKPVWCLIHKKPHKGNNAKLCYSSKERIYVSCYSKKRGRSIDFIDGGTTNIDIDDDIDDNDDESDTDNTGFLGLDSNYIQYAQQQGIEVPDFVLKSIESQSVTNNGNNKLNEDLSQIDQRRVQAIPIIDGVVQPLSIENLFITASPCNVCKHSVDTPIINIKTTNADITPVYTMKEGQIVPPSTTTTIISFLNGNTKFPGGNKSNIKDIFNSYNKYRCGLGTTHPLHGGGTKNLATVLKSHGNIITRENVKGSRGEKETFVILKRPDPIVNTNPVEVLNALSSKTTVSTLKPADALNLNNKNQQSSNPTVTTITQTPSVNINKELRMMNPHIDVRNFWDIYMTQDPESNTDPDNLFKCFLEYCKENNAIPNRFGQRKLLNYIKKWLNIDSLKGWRCKTDMEEIENSKKEKNLRKIWRWNTAPSQIGWHNGKDNERYSKLTSKPWRKIDVNYRHDEYCRPIPQLIEMTKQFEKNLPDRVKEIQQRQFELLVLPYDSMKDEIKNIQTRLTNELLSGVIVKDSDEHNMLKNHIEQLKQEAFQRNREEYDRLEQSIKDDKDRLLEEISWCCAVRSTFGTGKTFNLRPYIEAFPEMRILIVLPRISLTTDYMREYEAMGFIIRDDKAKGKIRGNRIIVCYPSLKRVYGEFDLLVLDEFKAIMDLQHTLVKKNRKKNKVTGRYQSAEKETYDRLCHFVANTKRVYVADALLTNAHVLEIAKMRHQSEEFSKRVTVYQNLYQKHKDNIVFTVDNQYLLVDIIIKFLREGKRVTVPTNSKEYADFIRKEVIEFSSDVTISLSTSEEKPTVEISQLWKNMQCIIYTPTILAGNSYEEPVNVVCGLFTKLSCDQADALQMLMRCRNVISKEYYICVTEGPGRSPIPNTIYPTTEAIKRFLMNDDKYDSSNWPEEFKIPMDMGITRDPILDTIKADNMCFISHCNYMKQVHVATREYLFRMLLYMRDAGFSYGGNIYIKPIQKEAVATIKENKTEFSKKHKELDLDAKYTCDIVNTKEYQGLNNKTNKSKDDLRKILKYRIRHRYQVDNVPKWLFEVDRKHSKEFIRLRRYIRLNTVTDRNIRNELQINIRSELLHALKYNPPKEVILSTEATLTNDILLSEETYNVYEDIAQFWTEREIMLCENALKILELIGAETFIRNIPRFDIPYNEFNLTNRLNDFIVLKEYHLRRLINDFKSNIDKLASKITKKAFGITFNTTVIGYIVINQWILNGKLIWPYNWDDYNDREELRILIPEPTISHKSKTWINNKISHAPQLGAYVNNVVQAQGTILPQIPPVPVQRRIPAIPIINNNLKLVPVH